MKRARSKSMEEEQEPAAKKRKLNTNKLNKPNQRKFYCLNLSTSFIAFPKMIQMIKRGRNINSLKINQFQMKEKHDDITSDFSHGRTADDESYGKNRLVNDKYDFIHFLNKLAKALPNFVHQLKHLTVVDHRKEEVDNNVWDAGHRVKYNESMNHMIVLNAATSGNKIIAQKNRSLLDGFYRQELENDSNSSIPNIIVAIICGFAPIAWWSLASISVDHYIGPKLVEWISTNCPQIQLVQLTKYWPSSVPNACFRKLFQNCEYLTYIHIEQDYVHQNKGYSVSLADCKKINFNNFRGIKLVRTANFLYGNGTSWFPYCETKLFKKLFSEYIRNQWDGSATIEEFLQKKENQLHVIKFQDVRP
eukprot:317279_1